MKIYLPFFALIDRGIVILKMSQWLRTPEAHVSWYFTHPSLFVITHNIYGICNSYFVARTRALIADVKYAIYALSTIRNTRAACIMLRCAYIRYIRQMNVCIIREYETQTATHTQIVVSEKVNTE